MDVCVCVRTLTIQYTNVRIRRRGCAHGRGATVQFPRSPPSAAFLFGHKKKRRLANDCGMNSNIRYIYIYIIWRVYMCMRMHYAVYVVWLYIYMRECVRTRAYLCVGVSFLWSRRTTLCAPVLCCAARILHSYVALCCVRMSRTAHTELNIVFMLRAHSPRQNAHCMCGCVLCIGRRRTDRTTTRRCLWFVIRLSYVYIWIWWCCVDIA